MLLPEGWELAPYVPGLEEMVNMYDWSTHCMVTSDGFTWRCNNYGPPGDCIGGGYLEARNSFSSIAAADIGREK